MCESLCFSCLPGFTAVLLILISIGVAFVKRPVKDKSRPKDDITKSIVKEFNQECRRYLPGSLVKKEFHLKDYECEQLRSDLFDEVCMCHGERGNNIVSIYGYLPDKDMTIDQTCELIYAYYRLTNKTSIKVYILQKFTVYELRTILLKHGLSLSSVENTAKDNIYNLKYNW